LSNDDFTSFFAFLGLFKPFFDYFDKFLIMRNQKRRD